jgi:NADH:ubiquinone oxidoreductase subunit H
VREWFIIASSMIFVSSLWILVTLVLATAFSTLVERYMMATVQRRVGPDYLFFGVVQPLVDGLKLLTKDYVSVYRIWDSTYYVFVVLLLALTGVT